MTKQSTCRECGNPVEASRADAAFCSPGCRRDWNNRRQKRGAELYDLFMTIRHERQLVDDLKADTGVNLWTAACRLAAKWKEEDDQDRDGRRSWQAVKPMVHAGKFAYLETVYCGQDMTGRFSVDVGGGK